MKVSIITSAYNCKNYVREMIDSIIHQTICDWEMILIDDASDDGTWEIIDQIRDKRIVKIRNLTNIGLTRNLNRALEFAQGEYIVRMDADDIAVTNRIEKQVEFMEVNSEVVLSGCWMQCFGKMHDITKTHLNDEDICIDLIFNSAVMHPTFIVRNEVLKKHNIKYNESLRYAQDYDFTYQISKYGKLENIPETLLKYRVHSSQTSIANKEKQKKYADITRKKIIKDMGIILSDREFSIWSDFCIGKIGEYSCEEKKLLIKIVECIIDNNKLTNKYNGQKLKRMLSKKLKMAIASNGISINDPILEMEKYKRLFLMMGRWIKLKQVGDSLTEWFKIRNFQNIAIYGMGEVGECLVYVFKNSSIRVIYGIDREYDVRCSLKKIVSPDDELEKVDAVIITAIFYVDEIKRLLDGKINCPIISIEDIIYDIELK